MKNFKSLLLAVVVATGALFTSCTEDAATTVTISLDAVSVTSPAPITGKITAAGMLKTVSLLKDSASGSKTVAGWPKTTFVAGGAIVEGTMGAYTVRIENLAVGTYTLEATDKNDVKSTQKFTVTAAAVVAPTLTAVATATTIYCTVGDGSSLSTCASADGSTYAPNAATTAQQGKIDFVFYTGNGTTYGPAKCIYAPSAIPTLLTALNAWTVKNQTILVKTTAITYADATYSAVKTIADAATSNSVSGLVIGDVVVFKTAGTTPKYGVFKVNTITGSYTKDDNVNINIKVQN